MGEGRGWQEWVESRRRVKATIEDTDSSTVCPVSGTSSHNQQDKLRCSLAPHTSLLMQFTGSTGPVVHLHGLIGSRKAFCESRLGYLYPCVWCAWTVLECSLMLSHKLDFNCCANGDDFRKFSHIFILSSNY